MPKGNATTYVYPVSMKDGKLTIGQRTLVATGKEVSTKDAVDPLRRGETVMVELIGHDVTWLRKELGYGV